MSAQKHEDEARSLAKELAFPGRACVECDPVAGIWFPAYYFTDAVDVVAVGCACKPCETKELFCKSCRTRKAHREGRPTPWLRHNKDFSAFPEAPDPPGKGLRQHAKWVARWVVW